jgi:hypothetical protein
VTRHIHFSEYEYYSPILDAEVCRISIPDDNGQEFFAIVPTDGKGYRERRDKAIDTLLEAMRLGLTPGQVLVD